MKYRTFLWVAGGAIVAGAVVYGIYKYLQDQETTVAAQDTPKDDRERSDIPEIVHDDTSLGGTIITDFNQAQQDAVASIKKHHQEAAQQLGETLEEMAKDSAEFEEKINQVNNDLDDLLK